MGGTGERQLVLGRQLPHLPVDIAVHADAQVVTAVLRPRLWPGVGAAADAHGVPPGQLALEHVDEVLVAPLGDAVLDRPHLPGHLEVVAELDREPLARLLRHRPEELVQGGDLLVRQGLQAGVSRLQDYPERRCPTRRPRPQGRPQRGRGLQQERVPQCRGLKRSLPCGTWHRRSRLRSVADPAR